MNCNGLARSWEGNPEVREQIRASGKLLICPSGAKIVEATRNNCVASSHMLRPILAQLSRTPAWHLPHLDPLQVELALLAEKVGVTLGDKGVHAPAVELKKLASFVKRRARRKEVTKDLRFHQLLLLLDPSLKETIDNYMESTKQGRGSSSSMSGADEIQDNFDDEDPESVSDFAEFQQWLNAGSPARPSLPEREVNPEPSSSGLSRQKSMPPPMAPTVPGCKCFKKPCICDKLRQVKAAIAAKKLAIQQASSASSKSSTSASGELAPTAVATDVADTLPMEDAVVEECITRASQEAVDVEVPATQPSLDGDIFEDLAPNEDWLSKPTDAESKVLTRRDQLKMKSDQEKEKNEAKAKALEQEDDGENGEDERPKGSRPKTVPSAKASGKAKAKGEAKSKARGKRKQADLDAQQPDDQQMPEEPQPKHGADCPTSPVPEASKGDDDDDDMKTPKKALFMSDDENEMVPTVMKNTKFLCPKTGKEKTLKEIYDSYLPSAWKRSRPSAGSSGHGALPDTAGPEPKPKKVKKAPKTPKAKAKSKASAKSKAKAKASPKKLLSPSMKKEIQRRKKKNDKVMETQGSDMESSLMQGVIHEKLKKVVSMQFPELKEYLKVEACPDCDHSHTCFSPYWKTSAVGLLQRNEKGKKTHLILFSNRTSQNDNVNMAAAYCCAWLMAEWVKEDPARLDDFKDPTSAFQQEVTKIKYNASQVLQRDDF